ncbi:hypothetical protein [Caulobacter sp. RHG1]|uniref:hypothetical protein n=1 Tax=Caulobacter sp. (strain RHG1) TaxID=2545762 RepID=UPI001552796D|nr:hypothetical protein [Caulobacter sp. RHG1]NQE63788.1 hypothetical protein [Caulobacter sp. RHG1]
MNYAHLYQWIGFAWLAAGVAPALLRGGWPERSSAAAMIVAWFGSGLVQNTSQFFGPQVGITLIDLMLLTLLVTIALVSDRWWPMWAAAFHGLGVMLHLAVLLDEKVMGRAYFIAGTVFSFLTVLALFLGSIQRRRVSALSPPDAASPLT